MPNNQFDVNVNNSVLLLLITTLMYVRLSGWWNVPVFLTNQNHCFMPTVNARFILDNKTSNSVNNLKVAIPLKGAITFCIRAPPAKVSIS